MKISFVSILLLATYGGMAQTNFRTNGTGGGVWNATSTWQMETPNGSGTWVAAVSTPTSASNTILIQTNDNVTVTANVTIDQTTIQTSGSITVGPGIILSINNGAGLDLSVSGTITVNGTLTNTGSAANTMTFSGASIVNNGTINLTSGTLTLNGATSFSGTPNTTTLFTVTASGGATASSSIGFTTNGLLTVNASTFTANAGFTASAGITVTGVGSAFTANNTPLSVAGALTITSPGSFTANAGADVILANNLAGTGAFTSNALVTFNATTTISNTGAKTFTDVTVSGTVNVTANVTSTVNGNLVNNGTINCTNGTWAFGGNTKTISGTSPTATNFFNLTVNSGSSVAVDVNIPSIQIAGTSLAATGTFTSNAPVTFNRAGATALTGTGATFNNNVTVASGTTFNGAGSFAMTGNHQLACNGTGTITTTGAATFGGTTTTSTDTPAKTFSFGAITVNGDVTLGSGINFVSTAVSPTTGLTLASGTIHLNGQTLTVGTGQISITTGVIDATVPSTVTIGATGAVTGTLAFINGSSLTSFTVARSVTIQGDVTVNTLTLNTAGTVVTQSSGTFTIGNNGSITSAGGKLSLASPIIAPGVYDLSYTIAAALTTGDELSSSLTAIRNFTKAGTSTLTLNKDLTANGAFTLSAGTLTASGNAVTVNGVTNTIIGTAISNFAVLNINGPLTKSSTGITTITGNVALGAGGSIDFSTGGATTFTTNTTLSNAGSGTIAFNALNVTTTAGALKAGAPFSAAGVVTVTNPGSFTANAGADVTLANNLAGTGAFTSNALVTFNATTTISNTGIKTFTDVMMSGIVNVTANVTSTVNGNLVNNGTINCTNGTWAFGGNTKTISGTSPTATNFFNLTIVNGASISASIPFTTAGALNIVAASGTAGVANLNTTAGFTANAAVNVFGTGSNFNANTGAFSVAGALTLGTGNFFTIDATSIAILLGNLTANGTGTFTNNGTLIVGANLTGTGTLTQGINATLNIGGTSTITTLTATANGNTVNYTANAAQTIHNNPYINLGLSGSGTKTAIASLTILGNVDIESGTTFIDGAFTHSVGGNWINNGGIFTGTGTINLNGTTQNIGGSSSTTFNNLTLSGSGGVIKTFAVPTVVSGALIISTGAKAGLSLTSINSYTAGTLTLGSTTKTSGDYGSSISSAPPANRDDTFFDVNEAGVVQINSNIFYSIAGGLFLWNDPNTWSTSGHNGTAGASFPQAGDIAVIGSGHTITVTGAQGCQGLSFDGAGTVSISSGAALTVSGDVTGTGTSTSSFVAVANTGLLQVGGALSSAIGTFTPTLPANSTVEFNGIGAQAIPAFTYGNLTLSGSGNKTMATSFNIGGNLIINNGAIFTVGAFTTTTTGTTIVNGTLSITSATGTKTFIGLVTINSGATWNNSGNEGFTFRNGVTNNGGTFTAGTGTYTFSTNAQALTGTFIIPSITVTAITLTNNNTLTVGTVLSGTGTLAQAANAILNIGGTSGITNLDASANPNTVNYTGAAAQTVHLGNYYDLNLSGAGAKTLLAGTNSVGNSLTVTGGALTNNGTLTVAGALSGAGTLTQAASATLNIGGASDITNLNASIVTNTVNYTGSGAQTVHLGNYYDLNLSGAGTKSLPVGATSVGNNLTLTGGMLTNNGSLTVTSNFTLGGAATFASSNTSVGGLTFNSGASINADGSSTVTIGGDFTGIGDYASSGTTIFNGIVALSAVGAISFQDLVVNGTSMTPGLNINYTVTGNLSGTGILNAGTGTATTTFGGSGNQNVSVTNANFNNVTINSGSTLVAATTIGITGDLAITGSFTHGNQNVTFTTAGAKTISGSATTFYNLTVGDATNVSTNVTNGLAPLSLAGVLIIKPQTISNTNTFNTGGQDNFILLSNSDTNIGTGSNYGGSIGPLGTGSVISGNFTAQRYASDKNRLWRYISSPVVGATVAQLKAAIPVTGVFTDPSNTSSTPPCTGCNTTSPSLFYYNETTSAYVAFPASGQTSSGTTFFNGRGYSAFFRHEGLGGVGGPVTINFKGANPSVTGVPLPVSPNVGVFSLVGNPYPSPIVWGSTGWNRSGIASVMYVPEIVSGTDLTSVPHDITENFVVAPGQAFWVQSSTAGASLTIDETAKYTGTSGYQFFRTAAPVLDQLVVSLTKQGSDVTDKAFIKISEDSKLAFDNYDGIKFNSRLLSGDVDMEDPFAAASVYNISILSDDLLPKALAYSAVPSVSFGQVFNLKLADLVVAGQNTTDYTLGVNPSGEFSDFLWILNDHYTGMDVNLLENQVYKFTVNNSINASKSETRFTLKAVSTDVKSPEEIEAVTWVYPNPVSETLNVVVNKQEPVQVNLFNTTGQFMSNINMEKQDNGWKGKYDVKGQPQGIYLVRISSGGKNIAYKIVVQ